MKHNHNNLFKRITSLCVSVIFIISVIIPPQSVHAQSMLNLPVPGAMITTTPGFTPPLIKGLKFYPEQPFRFDFIVPYYPANCN